MDKITKAKEWVSVSTDEEDRYDLIFTTSSNPNGEKLATIYRKTGIMPTNYQYFLKFYRNINPFYFTSELLGVKDEVLLSEDDVMELIGGNPRVDLVREAKLEVEDKIQELCKGLVLKYSELLRMFRS